jgi:uncharacterized protein (DUF983 family)
MPGTGISTTAAIVQQLCPRCRRSRIFRSSIFTGFPKMYERCPSCGLKYEREPGYFLGAMYISYGLALVTITAIAVLLWLAVGWSLQKSVVVAILVFLPLAWPLTLLARVLWIHLDQAIDPERDEI